MDDIGIIKRVIEKGQVAFGMKAAQKADKAKLLVIAFNIPEDNREKVEKAAKKNGVPVYNYAGTSLELGEVCRNPFPVSVLTILNPGDAKITDLVKEAKK